MGKYDDFSAKDIFIKDKNGNTIYKREKRYYIVNDKKIQKRLKELEGYRYFIFERRSATFFISLIFLGIPLSIVLNLIFPSIDGEFWPLLIAIISEQIARYLYNRKIDKILEGVEFYEINYSPKEIKKSTKSNPLKPHISKNKSYTIYYPKAQKSIKDYIPDLNLLHIILFLIIAFPTIFFIYSIIKTFLFG